MDACGHEEKEFFFFSKYPDITAARVPLFEDNATIQTNVHVLHSFRLRLMHTRAKNLSRNRTNFLSLESWNSNEKKRRRNSKTGRNIPNALEKRAGEFYICVLATPWAKTRDSCCETNRIELSLVKKLWSMPRGCGKTAIYRWNFHRLRFDLGIKKTRVQIRIKSVWNVKKYKRDEKKDYWRMKGLEEEADYRIRDRKEEMN